MAERRLVLAVALGLGLVFLILFLIVSGPLASSPAETGPLQLLSRFFTPGMKADPVQYLTGQVVRIALGFLALSWLAVAAIPRGTADATIRAALRLDFHCRRALLAFVLGAHVLASLGALQLFISYGGTPTWISEVYTLGLPGYFLMLLPRALGLLACIRLLFGRRRAPYDYYLGAFAAMGSGMALIPDLRRLVGGSFRAASADLIFSLIGQALFSTLAIWAGILLVRAALPLAGRISGKALAAYTVAGGIVFARSLDHLLGIANVFRFAPSIAWADALAAVVFFVFATACLSHAAAMAMIQPAEASPAPLPPETAEAPEPTPADSAPEDASVAPKDDAPALSRPRFRLSLTLTVDAVLGFICSGLLAVLAMYALTKVLPLGVLVYFPIAPLMSVGGFVVLVVGILIQRFGYVLGAALFELGFWLLVAR